MRPLLLSVCNRYIPGAGTAVLVQQTAVALKSMYQVSGAPLLLILILRCFRPQTGEVPTYVPVDLIAHHIIRQTMIRQTDHTGTRPRHKSESLKFDSCDTITQVGARRHAGDDVC